MSATPLKNPKHEAFCQARASGETQDAAYEIAGYEPSRASASRLATNANIIERIQFLQKRIDHRLQMTRDRAAEILARIAEEGEQDKDKIASLKLLGDWTGWKAAEKIEHSIDMTKIEWARRIRGRK